MDSCIEYSKYISPMDEIAAYEAIWDIWDNVSYKKIADKFSQYQDCIPSSFVERRTLDFYKREMLDILHNLAFPIGALINNTMDYPDKLKSAEYPLELLYVAGNTNYLYRKGVSVVGTRHPTENGIKRTKKLVRLLVENNLVIYSGLADGIDTTAHRTAIEEGGRTVAVIGTPLNTTYPKRNIELQKELIKNHLVVSQVPFIHYSKQDYRINRTFFPERNKTMSALSDATIIVEAGETSGSLIQAKAALKQGKKLFILQNCFENRTITWPAKFEQKGAIRVREISDILNNI